MQKAKSARELIENFRILAKVPALSESQPSDIIIQQLGGFGRLRAMLGAKITATHGGKGVGIRWPSKQPSRGNYVEVSLRPDDTYDVEFFNIRGGNKRTIKHLAGIYADQLVSAFEKQTGYYLKL